MGGEESHDMQSLWDEIDKHRKAYLTLYYHALALDPCKKEEKESRNLEPVVKVKVGYVIHGREEDVIAEYASYQHRRKPAQHERCLSPDQHPEHESVDKDCAY